MASRFFYDKRLRQVVWKQGVLQLLRVSFFSQIMGIFMNLLISFRSLTISSLFLLFLTACSPRGEAGFFSSDIRLVESVPGPWDSTNNPILKNGQVILASTLFSEKLLKPTYQLNAWKGERVHVQVVMKTKAGKEKNRFSLEVSPLVNENGDEITASNISVRQITYVLTDEYRSGCGYRPDSSAFYTSTVTDPLIPNAEPVLSADSLAYFWISIQVPQDAQPGIYQSAVNTSNNVKLDLELTVNSRTLPPPSDWTFDLDLWQHPAAIARVHNVPLWSSTHYEKMRPYYEQLAAAGQKNITTSIVHEPWGHQTFDDFPSLIRWIKKTDGSWSYDFSRFDEYVEFVMSCGINKRINCYSMIPWKMMVRYYDESTQQDTSIATEINTPAYVATWKPMLEAFTSHLKQKNWFDITSIAMDERPMPAMKSAMALLKSIDPSWKIALAGDYHPEIEREIFDYCVASRWSLDSTILHRRIDEKRPSTFYTCCTEAFPNGFTFSPPAEHVFLGWFAQAKGFTGYLRWAYNSWTRDPFHDSRYTAWPAGDTYQIYPGPSSSIRFEKLVEGIQDFEKIRILKEEWSKSNQQEKLIQLKQLLDKIEIAKLEKQSAQSLIGESKMRLLELQ